jgi:hypothetical protein
MGDPQLGVSKDPGRVIATPFYIDDTKRIGIQFGEAGDGTPIFYVCTIWVESQSVSDLPNGKAHAYTIQAARKWIEKNFKTPACKV